MSLRDFLATSATRASKPALQVVPEAADTPEVAAPQAPASAPAAPHYGHSAAYLALRARIHGKLLERFDLAALESLPTQTLQQEIASMTERLLEAQQRGLWENPGEYREALENLLLDSEES